MSRPVTYRRDESIATITMDDGKVNALGPTMLQALNEALEKLAELDPRKADVVRYRILWGLTTNEVGEALGVSPATVERDWAFAKAWLSKELAAKDEADQDEP